jgi:hypothetical protein
VRFVAAFEGHADSSESIVEQSVPAAGSISRLFVKLTSGPGAGASYTFFVRKSGADTALACTISGTAATCSDLVNSVSFAAGDLLSVRVQPTGGPAGREMRWMAVFGP